MEVTNLTPSVCGNQSYTISTKMQQIYECMEVINLTPSVCENQIYSMSTKK